jgi:hypothetical protein
MDEDGAVEADLPPRLLVGVALRRPPTDPRSAVEALRVAVEEVVLPATFVELDWRTTVVTPADDLERGSGRRQDGRWWDILAQASARLESGGVAGLRQDVPHDQLPPDPTANPVNAVARLLPGKGATLAWSVHRWAVRDWPSFLRSASRWLLDTATTLDADSGYVTLDVVDAVQPQSAWEIVARVPPGQRDLERCLWGYGWGTLLSSSQVGAIGGIDRLQAVPGSVLRQGSSGHTWVRLGEDPADLDRSSVAALREALGPVLPHGLSSVEEYFTPRTNPFASAPAPYVV